MTTMKNKFDESVHSIRSLEAIYDYFEPRIKIFDITEILRAEYVLIVSALDYYIHEVVREGILKLLENENEYSGLNKISIPLNTVKVLINLDDEFERKRVLSSIIKEITSKDSYQAPRAVEYALGLIEFKKVWTTLGSQWNEAPEHIKNRLALIVNRRNKIAHESDIDFITGDKITIDKSMIIECVEFCQKFVFEIDQLFESSFN